METCENCGRTIGRLERACVWDDQTVCVECHGHLSASGPSPDAVPEIRRDPLMSLAESQRHRVRPVLVERTSKRWKRHIDIGGGIAGFGCMFLIIGCGKGNGILTWMGLSLIVVGVLWAAVAKRKAWWETG